LGKNISIFLQNLFLRYLLQCEAISINVLNIVRITSENYDVVVFEFSPAYACMSLIEEYLRIM